MFGGRDKGGRGLTMLGGFGVGLGGAVLVWLVSALAVTGLVGLITFIVTGGPPGPMARSSSQVYFSKCPLRVKEGDAYQVQISSAGDGQRAEFYLEFGAGTASPGDYPPGGGMYNTLTPSYLTFHSEPDDLIEGDEMFTVKVGSDEGRVGVNSDQRCEMTILDDVARVSSVRMTSSPADGHTYHKGEAIEIQVRFDDQVRVEGEPEVTLWLADPEGSRWTPPANRWEWRNAEYGGSSGADTLDFTYLVAPGDMDADGLIIAPMNSTGMGEGTIKRLSDGRVADHTSPGLLTELKVDGNW